MPLSSAATAPGLQVGRVLFFSPAKGYGFIRVDCCGHASPAHHIVCGRCGAVLQDVYVHYSALEGPPGHRNLFAEQRVQFQRRLGARGWFAHAVTVITETGVHHDTVR